MPSPFDWGNRFHSFWGYVYGHGLERREQQHYSNKLPLVYCRYCGDLMEEAAHHVPPYLTRNCPSCGSKVTEDRFGDLRWTPGH